MDNQEIKTDGADAMKDILEEQDKSEETTDNKEEVFSTAKEEDETAENTDNEKKNGTGQTEQSDDDGETENDDEQKTGEKKSFFKKEKKKDKKDELIEELTDKYKRTFAEFDNFRKRSEKEKSAMYEIGAKDIIEKILPVVDNFERGFRAISEEEKATPFAEGMDKIYQQLIKTLEDTGVKEIEAMGKEFDPNLHNAVMHVEDENLGENVVAEVLQKGYTYRDSVVRHSMVKVAN